MKRDKSGFFKKIHPRFSPKNRDFPLSRPNPHIHFMKSKKGQYEYRKHKRQHPTYERENTWPKTLSFQAANLSFARMRQITDLREELREDRPHA